jgi:hypothetical protein
MEFLAFPQIIFFLSTQTPTSSQQTSNNNLAYFIHPLACQFAATETTWTIQAPRVASSAVWMIPSTSHPLPFVLLESQPFILIRWLCLAAEQACCTTVSLPGYPWVMFTSLACSVVSVVFFSKQHEANDYLNSMEAKV